jgi:hypothetical protein
MIPSEELKVEAQPADSPIKGEVRAHEDICTQAKTGWFDGARTFVSRYDSMFLIMLGAQYFSQGSKVLLGLAASSLFKDTFKLEPGYLQVLSSFIGLPWSLKIFYGIISDNYPLYGSRRKSYLFLMSCIQLVTMLALFSYTGTNEVVVTMMLAVTSLTVAVNDVIVDSLMVIQSRRYPKDGSE